MTATAQAKSQTTTQARKALFRDELPEFRAAKYEDIKWMWAAYSMQGKEEVDQEQFSGWISDHLSLYDRVYICEDRNHKFSDKRGPVSLFVVNYDEWNLEPHVEHFPWATPRNKVRSVVGFLTMQRFKPDVGCIRIHTDDEHKEFFKRMKRFLPIRVGGKIYGGRPDGADNIFYIRGARK